LAWTEDGLLRQVVYEGVREDEPAGDVVRGREEEDVALISPNPGEHFKVLLQIRFRPQVGRGLNR
jgi:hypothetical protein